MQDFILTLVVIFVIYKILGSFRSANYTFTQNNYNGRDEQSRNGRVKIDFIPDKKKGRKKKDNDNDGEGGEYVDFEEIK